MDEIGPDRGAAGALDMAKVLLLQRFLKRRLVERRVARLQNQAGSLQNAAATADPTCQEVAAKAIADRSIGQTNADLWMEILEFAPTAIGSLSGTCRMMHEISKFNLMWMPLCRDRFPKVFEKRQEEHLAKTSLFSDVNWKSLVRQKDLTLQAFFEVVGVLEAKREEGNKQFKGQAFEDASTQYNAGIKFAGQSQNSLQRYDEVLSVGARLAYLHVLTVLNANAAQAELKLDHPERALMNGVVAQKTLKVIKKLLADPRAFKARYATLLEKISFRIDTALAELGPLARFVNYSPQPVEGLQQGTMLSHVQRGFGGFFDDTLVLMTEMTERSVVGLIINKTYTTVGGDTFFVGGPCELDQITVLANRELPGSRRVIDGVFQLEDGDEVDVQALVAANPGLIVQKFRGYSSWFPGQLQGEILNSNGWDMTNDVDAEEVFTPATLFEFSHEDLDDRL